MDKVEKKLYKQLKKAIAHQDEHPLSNSANRDVHIAQAALETYILDNSVEQQPYPNQNMEGNYHCFR